MIHFPHEVRMEAQFFFARWQRGGDIKQLRADILPGERSDEWNREFRLRVLDEFERRVAAWREQEVMA